jgi:hypothetical protein
MKKYTYRVHFIAPQETVVSNCDNPVDWSSIGTDRLCQFNLPKGKVIINMRNVTVIEEIIEEE